MSPTLRNILAGVAGAFASMPANALLLMPLGGLFGARHVCLPGRVCV